MEVELRQKQFFNRAVHQLRQIQRFSRQVVGLSKHLNTLAVEVSDSQVNCRKVEVLKTQIKDKLREFATNIDEIYQILDRKIIVLMREVNKQTKQSILKNEDKLQQSNNFFSDTLNPRITQLETKIMHHQSNQKVLKQNIIQLKAKNDSLLEQFNRLSTASNKKIDELNKALSHKPSQQTENSFQNTSNIHSEHYPSFTNKKRPQLKFNPELPYDVVNSVSYPKEKKQFFNFGCMPTASKEKTDGIKAEYSRMDMGGKGDFDHDDMNRRFDLLLLNLRDQKQDSTLSSRGEKRGSNKQKESNENNKERGYEQPKSVFSQTLVRRYQI